MEFKELPTDAPVMAVVESGPDMMLTIAHIGFVSYKREQSKSLAARLRAAADLVEKQE